MRKMSLHSTLKNAILKVKSLKIRQKIPIKIDKKCAAVRPARINNKKSMILKVFSAKKSKF